MGRYTTSDRVFLKGAMILCGWYATFVLAIRTAIVALPPETSVPECVQDVCETPRERVWIRAVFVVIGLFGALVLSLVALSFTSRRTDLPLVASTQALGAGLLAVFLLWVGLLLFIVVNR